MRVPVLRTERLILRGRTMEDFPAYSAMWADPVVASGAGGRVLNEEEAWTKFTRMVGFWALKGYGFWIVEEIATGRFVGECGCGEFKRHIDPSMTGKPEFGWIVTRQMQGKGYATEAACAGLIWADANLRGATMSCMIDLPNAASIRVAEKCGFREAARSTYSGKGVIIFERPARAAPDRHAV